MDVCVILDTETERHWYAKIDNHSGVIPWFPAAMIDAAVKIGAAAWKECPECGYDELVRADDFLCINCRSDAWLDLSDVLSQPEAIAVMP